MANTTPPSLPISRWSDPASLVIGARVVVRRRLTATGPDGTHLTDVIGTVLSLEPLIIRRHTAGTPDDDITIDPDLVTVIKPLPAHPVRNSDIRAIEHAYALAFPGVVHHEWVDGWLVRVGDGITERSNSAIPLEPHTAFSAVPIDAIRDIYRQHGLPTLIAAPDRIARPAFRMPGEWTRGPDIITMTKELHTTTATGDTTEDSTNPHTGRQVHTNPTADPSIEITWDITDHPTDDWLSLYHFRGRPLPASALQHLSHSIDGLVGFGHLRVNGTTVAITRGTITRSPDGRTWLGYSAVNVEQSYRRQGLATRLGTIMMNWGAHHGADNAYLHVIESNVPGRALYHSLGFGDHHRHRYLTDTSPLRMTLSHHQGSPSA